MIHHLTRSCVIRTWPCCGYALQQFQAYPGYFQQPLPQCSRYPTQLTQTLTCWPHSRSLSYRHELIAQVPPSLTFCPQPPFTSQGAHSIRRPGLAPTTNSLRRLLATLSRLFHCLNWPLAHFCFFMPADATPWFASSIALFRFWS